MKYQVYIFFYRQYAFYIKLIRFQIKRINAVLNKIYIKKNNLIRSEETLNSQNSESNNDLASINWREYETKSFRSLILSN